MGLKGNEDCSQQEIRNAYLKKCKELHPDRNIETTEGQKTLSEEDSKRLFQEVNEAYSILSKENERSSYDLFLKQSSTRSYTNNFNQRQYSNTGFTGTKRYPFDNDVFKQYEEFKKRREREEEMFGYKFREYSEKSGTDFRGHHYNPYGSSYQRPRRRPYNPYRNPLFETANRTSRILIFCFTLMLIGNILRFVVYEYKMARDSEYGLRETQRLSREYVDAREKARFVIFKFIFEKQSFALFVLITDSIVQRKELSTLHKHFNVLDKKVR